MVKCKHCSLLEDLINSSDEYVNKCALYGVWNLDPEEERNCLDFQPGL